MMSLFRTTFIRGVDTRKRHFSEAVTRKSRHCSILELHFRNGLNSQPIFDLNCHTSITKMGNRQSTSSDGTKLWKQTSFICVSIWASSVDYLTFVVRSTNTGR